MFALHALDNTVHFQDSNSPDGEAVSHDNGVAVATAWPIQAAGVICTPASSGAGTNGSLCTRPSPLLTSKTHACHIYRGGRSRANGEDGSELQTKEMRSFADRNLGSVV